MKNELDLSLIKVDISLCYDAVCDAISALADSIREDSALPCWMSEGTAENARALAINGIQSIFSQEGQAKNQTINCIGVIGASEETLTRIAELNEKKAAFEHAMKPLSKKQRMAPDPDDPTRKISTPLARIVLREMKLGNLLQRQLTRKLVALDYKPIRIGFTSTARSPSVVQITTEQARNRLIRLGDDFNIKQQLNLLDKLDNNEKLAVVTPIPEHIRQNIAYHNQQGVKCTTQTKTSLPLFLPASEGDSLPTITMRHTATRKKPKSNKTIEDHPYLSAIHVHRYIRVVRNKFESNEQQTLFAHSE